MGIAEIATLDLQDDEKQLRAAMQDLTHSLSRSSRNPKNTPVHIRNARPTPELSSTGAAISAIVGGPAAHEVVSGSAPAAHTARHIGRRSPLRGTLSAAGRGLPLAGARPPIRARRRRPKTAGETCLAQAPEALVLCAVRPL